MAKKRLIANLTYSGSNRIEFLKSVLADQLKKYQSFCKNNSHLLDKDPSQIQGKQRRVYLSTLNDRAEREATIANSYRVIGDSTSAISWYERSLASNKDDKETRLKFYIFLCQLELYKQAIDLFPNANDIDSITHARKLDLSDSEYFDHCYCLGRAYTQEENIPTNTTRARLYLLRAYQMKNRIDQSQLFKAKGEKPHPWIAECIAQTYDQDEDFEACRTWRNIAIEGGDISAKYNYAVMIYNGEVEDTTDRAVELFKEVAKEQHARERPNALNYLGMIFEEKGDLETAKKYYNLSTMLKNTNAQINLARLNYEYFRDSGGKEEAEKICRELMEKGIPGAYSMLGKMIWESATTDGRIQEVKDEVKDYFTKAHELSPSADTANNLYCVYSFGYKDNVTAIALCLEALSFNKNHPLARHNLYALFYEWAKELGTQADSLTGLLKEIVSILSANLAADDPLLFKFTCLSQSFHNSQKGEIDDILEKLFPEASRKVAFQSQITQATAQLISQDSSLTKENKLKTLLKLARVMPRMADRVSAFVNCSNIISTESKGIHALNNSYQLFYEFLESIADASLKLETCLKLFHALSKCRIHPKTVRMKALIPKFIAQLKDPAHSDQANWEQLTSFMYDLIHMHFETKDFKNIMDWVFKQLQLQQEAPSLIEWRSILFSLAALHAHYRIYDQSQSICQMVESCLTEIIKYKDTLNNTQPHLAVLRQYSVALTYFIEHQLVAPNMHSEALKSALEGDITEKVSVLAHYKVIIEALLSLGFVRLNAGIMLHSELFSDIFLPQLNTLITINFSFDRFVASGRQKNKVSKPKHPLVNLRDAMIEIHKKKSGPIKHITLDEEELNTTFSGQAASLLVGKFIEHDVQIPPKLSTLRPVAIGAEQTAPEAEPTEVPDLPPQPVENPYADASSN